MAIFRLYAGLTSQLMVMSLRMTVVFNPWPTFNTVIRHPGIVRFVDVLPKILIVGIYPVFRILKLVPEIKPPPVVFDEADGFPEIGSHRMGKGSIVVPVIFHGFTVGIGVRLTPVELGLKEQVLILKRIKSFKDELPAELVAPPAFTIPELFKFKFIEDQLPVKGAVAANDKTYI